LNFQHFRAIRILSEIVLFSVPIRRSFYQFLPDRQQFLIFARNVRLLLDRGGLIGLNRRNGIRNRSSLFYPIQGRRIIVSRIHRFDGLGIAFVIPKGIERDQRTDTEGSESDNNIQ
jgi:hypothetical protein